jgi:hypothetical protein
MLLGCSCLALGCFLIFWLLLAHLGSSWASLGHLGRNLGFLGVFVGYLKPSWGHLGLSGNHFWSILEIFRRILGSSWGQLEAILPSWPRPPEWLQKLSEKCAKIMQFWNPK